MGKSEILDLHFFKIVNNKIYILQLSKANDNSDCIELSRLNLANLIGIAKETLIRTLKDFKEEKIIETDRNSVRIIDFEKLTLIK